MCTWLSCNHVAMDLVHRERQNGVKGINICMGWILNSGRSWFDGALVDEGDDGTEGEPGAEVSFGEVAMEMQSLWNDFVNL